MRCGTQKAWSSLSTSSTGSPNDTTTRGGTRLPWTILILGVVGLLLAFYIGSQVLGVLVGILFPPTPPLLSNLTLVSHQSDGHGVDEWVYDFDQSPCEVVAFYQSNGGTCEVTPDYCQLSDGDSVHMPDQPVATCSGESTFSIFAMRWDAIIETGATPEQTRFRLSREVFWTGAVPSREFPLPESDDLGDN